MNQTNKNSLNNLNYNHTPNTEEKVKCLFEKYGLEIIEYTYKNTNTRMLCKDKEGYYVMGCFGSLQNGVSNFQIFSVTCNEKNFIKNTKLYAYKNKISSEILEWKKSNVKNHINVKCKCECGSEFWCDFTHWKNLSKNRCNECTSKTSNIAYITKRWLDDNDIKYTTEKRFDDCRNKKKLPFDFYLDDYNYCIEVDGQQHYYSNSTKYFKNGVFSKEDFDRIKINDNIKTEYCKTNNIKLIRLKYTLFKNKSEKYKEKLSNEIFNS